MRFMHRVSASRDGSAGPSRTIVLNRNQGEDASAELRASEIRFTRFFNSTPMAIAGVDLQGRILRTNAPFLSLFSAVVDRDAVDRKVRLDTVIHERDRAAFAAALEKARLKQADIEPIDTVLPNNEDRHIRFYVNAVADGSGGEEAEESAIVYAVDTTEQKALEGQMAQSQKMQAVGQLAGGIAHDFNNVLTAIIMASDLLLTNHRPSDPSFPDIMNIKQNANRAASLVRQLLAFSRKQTLRPEVLNLTDVLADLRMLLARLVGNQIKLKVDHGRDLWPVKVDIGQLEQVVVNLAVNARDAMPDGGELTVRTKNVARRRDEGLRLPRNRAGGLCAGRGRGHRNRHRARRAEEDLRTVLHHQGGRQGHGPRPLDGLRHHQADRRLHLLRFRSGQGDGVPHLPAAPCAGSDGAARGRDGGFGLRKRSGAGDQGSGRFQGSVRVGDRAAGRGRGRRAHGRRQGADLARIHGARGVVGRRGAGNLQRARRQDRYRRFRRGDARDGRADPAWRIAQAAGPTSSSSSSPAMPRTRSPRTCPRKRSSASCRSRFR